MAQHSHTYRKAAASSSAVTLLLILACTCRTAAAIAYSSIARLEDAEVASVDVRDDALPLEGAAVVHDLFGSDSSTDKPASALRHMDTEVQDVLRRFMSETAPAYPGSTPPPPPSPSPSPTPSPSPLPSLAVGLTDPCDICNDCLMVMSGVAAASLAGASADARSAAFLTACSARAAFSAAACSALSNIILAGTTNTAARAGLLCVNLGACSLTSCAAPALFNATKIGAAGTTLTSADLDLCSAEGVTGGAPTPLPSAARTADSCRVASDCTAAGAVCSIPEKAAPQVCECAAGRDVCYSLGTCISYCALNSTLATVASMNGGAAVCDPAAAASPACAADEVCAAPAGGCSQWECDPATQSLKQVACAGRCQPQALKVLAAALSDAGDAVEVTLSAAAAPLALVPCAAVFDAASAALLGADALCRSSGNTLTAQLAPTAKLMPGMSLTLLSAGSVLVGALDATRPFAGSAIVAKCSACASPKPTVAGPATITQPCASAAGGLLAAAASQPPAFDASTSTDPSGRAEWADVKWSLEAAGPEAGRAALATAVERTNAFAAARDRLRLSLTAAEASSLEDGSYGLKVTLTSWLGTSASAMAAFAKASTSPAPLVQIAGAASGQTFKISAGLRAAAESGPLCKGQSLEWRWTAVSPAGWSGLPAAGAAGQQLYLAAPVPAVHGQKVGLKVKAAYVGATDASAFGSAELSLIAVGSAPLAALTGPSGDVADTQPLAFNATASSDPDATAGTQRLSYRWACRREDHPAPCFAGAAQGDAASAPGVWSLPAGLLASGKAHTITVTVSKEVAAGAAALEAVAAITVRPRSAAVPFPRGVLARACAAATCAAPHATDSPLTVTLTLAPGYEAATVDWSSPELSAAALAALPGLVAAPAATPAVRVLTLPAALLPSNRAAITLAVNLSLAGAASMNTTTIALNSAPACSLAAAATAATGAAADADANAGCLRLEVLDATFPTAAVAVHAAGWLDGQDAQLRYEFGVHDTATGHDKMQRVGVAASATLVGLPAGSVTLYACALDSGGSRTCGARVVTIAQPSADFNVSAAAASLDVDALVASKDMGSLLQAGSSLANLLSFTSASSAGNGSSSNNGNGNGNGNNGNGNGGSAATVDPAVGAAIAKQSVALVSAILTGTSMSDPEAAQQAISVISAVAGSAAAFLPASAKAVMAGAAKAAAATIKSDAPSDFLSNICRLLGVSMPAAAANSTNANANANANSTHAAGRNAITGTTTTTGGSGSTARRALLQAADANSTAANNNDPAATAAARIADLLSVSDRLGATLAGKAVPGGSYTALGDGGVYVAAVALLPPAPGAGASAAVQALLRAGPDAAASASATTADTTGNATATSSAASAAKPARRQQRRNRRHLAAEATTTTTATATAAATGASSAAAALLLTGAAATAGGGLGLGLQYAPSAGAALQAALASSALAADTTLLTAAGLTTASWRTATGAAAPAGAAPTFDGSSASYLTLSIPAPGVDATRSVGCIAYDPAAAAPTGAFIAGTLDAATGRVTCRTDATGSFLVAQGAALPTATATTTTTDAGAASATTSATSGSGGGGVTFIDQSAASGGSSGPSDPTVVVLSAVLGAIGAILVAGVIALLYIMRKRRQAEHGVVPIENFHVVNYSPVFEPEAYEGVVLAPSPAGPRASASAAAGGNAFAPGAGGSVHSVAGGFHRPTSVVVPLSPAGGAPRAAANYANAHIVSASSMDMSSPVLAFGDGAARDMTAPVITMSTAVPSVAVWTMAARSSRPGSPEAGAARHGSTTSSHHSRSPASVSPAPPPPPRQQGSGPAPWVPPRLVAPVASARHW
ncbi:hypothetical protein HXX76_000524 [Chlamydomonas incerta]|uniref:PKD/REJ-like domain-containing protein n=1 Tax=Chlamydomonas incerta TaxID=51695 RepID=A0A835WES9_CHLIN|nr:hypothetical protein HXX76_000524 [Chlamydomonas incerta]|eukprot:KAG2445921.1 hypothetical protein HXX76_000524 [Chlamydomonas incerta]